MGKTTNPITFIANVELAQKLRVAIVPGTTTSPPNVGIAGVGDAGIGINDVLAAITTLCAVEPFNKTGTLEMVANGVIAEGADVFPAAGGKISATAAGSALGKAMEASTADGDIIEILVYPNEMQMSNTPGTTDIATTSNTDEYVIVGKAGILVGVDFSSLAALTAHDTNYITFSVTNLGQGGAGSTAMLAATDVNTTKATGGSALVANAKRQLTLHGTAANLVVAEGDRLRIRFAASGTLAGAVTRPVANIKVQ
ncbi:MAG: hypothetical protein KAR42_18040 [candidate division Zixibacteria bacterium]|nr:hypothetical protein [candidate division Zixibacteria bacterium]